MISALGPDTPGEKFDEIIAGVAPTQNMYRCGAVRRGIEVYAGAVDGFDRFAGVEPEGFEEFKALPRQMLDLLRAFQEPADPEPGS